MGMVGIKSGTRGYCSPNQMTVQLQRASTNNHSISVTEKVVQGLPRVGVTVAQIGQALRQLYYTRPSGDWWPGKLDRWLYGAVIKASKWAVNARAAGGIPEIVVGNVFRDETWFKSKNHRLDIENWYGHNLRR